MLNGGQKKQKNAHSEIAHFKSSFSKIPIAVMYSNINEYYEYNATLHEGIHDFSDHFISSIFTSNVIKISSFKTLVCFSIFDMLKYVYVLYFVDQRELGNFTVFPRFVRILKTFIYDVNYYESK